MKFKNPRLFFVWTDGRTSPKQNAPLIFFRSLGHNYITASQRIQDFLEFFIMFSHRQAS